jgi:hypothetical protein
MTSYRELFSFSVPRCKAVTAPPVRDIILHPPPYEFALWGLKPDRAFGPGLGEITPHECESTPPFREGRFCNDGRMVAFRDGLLFLPNTTIAKLLDVGREMKEFAAAYASYLGTDFDLQAHFLSGADKEIAEGFSKAAEIVEEFLTGDHVAAAARGGAKLEDVPASIRSSLAKRDAIVLPYAQLVAVAITEGKPEGLWDRFKTGERECVCLVREDDAGARKAWSFSLRPDQNKNRPFAAVGKIFDWDDRPPASEYQSGKLNRHEATAVALIGARAESEIGQLWRAAERERMSETFRSRIRDEAANIQDRKAAVLHVAGAISAERKRQGTTDATIAKLALDRLGATADAFAKVPYARHGIPDAIAKLKATAAGQ